MTQDVIGFIGLASEKMSGEKLLKGLMMEQILTKNKIDRVDLFRNKMYTYTFTSTVYNNSFSLTSQSLILKGRKLYITQFILY